MACTAGGEWEPMNGAVNDVGLSPNEQVKPTQLNLQARQPKRHVVDTHTWYGSRGDMRLCARGQGARQTSTGRTLMFSLSHKFAPFGVLSQVQM